jgi:hypothetical protein
MKRMRMPKAKALLLLLGVAGFGAGCSDSSSSPGCSNPCDGACVSGRCLTTLASGINDPGWLAVDGTSVYFTVGGNSPASGPGLMRVSKTGGTLATIASQPDLSALALDATSIFWSASDGTLQTASLTGKMPATLASGLHVPQSLALDATSIYFAEANPGRISKVPLAGGAPVPLATGVSFPQGLVVDASNIYWVEGGGAPPDYDTRLMMMPLAGGTPTPLWDDGALATAALAVDAHNIYWTTSSSSTVNGSTVCTGKVLSMPIGGGAPTTLATGQDCPGPIAVDRSAVYWINEGSRYVGALMKIPLGGGAPVTLASGRIDAHAIAIDDTFVYWSEVGASAESTPQTGTGALMKTAKQ